MKQPVRLNPFALMALAALSAALTPVASQAKTTLTCLTGTDPLVANDATQIAAVRALVDGQCPCASYDGSKGNTHGNYQSCVAQTVNSQVPSGLRMQCKRTVKAYYAKSTCGKNPTRDFVPCVSKNSKSGKVMCTIQPTKKKDGTTPSPACSSTLKVTRVACPAQTSCIDAADDNGDLLIAAPGDTGACACSAVILDCGGGCVVDSSTDPNNCGACGNVCGPGQVCGSGVCVTTACANDIGTGCYWLSSIDGCWVRFPYNLPTCKFQDSCSPGGGDGSGGGCYRWTHCTACDNIYPNPSWP